MKLRITTAQISALECRDFSDPEEAPLVAAWNGGATLTVDDSNRDALFSILNEASNAEDAQAEMEDCKFARAAARSLGCLAGRVLTSAGK